MNKPALIGASLWLLALAGSYHLGNSPSSSSGPDSSLPRQSKLSTPTPPSGRQGTPLSFIQEQLPHRDDILIHDELWLTAADWASRNPEQAVASLNELQFENPRNPYLFAALSEWAAQTPQKALAWLENNLPTEEENQLYLKAALIRGMARENPDEALAYLLRQPKSLARSTITLVLGAWAQNDPAQLLSGLQNLPDHLRLHALQQAAVHLAPEMLESARTLSHTLSIPEEKSAFQNSLVDHWATREPRQALAWAQSLSDPKIIGTAAKHLARQTPLAASSWLESQKNTPAYDLSARAVAWSLVGLDPHRAFAQVAAISSPALRLETFEQLGRFWVSDQPHQARAFFQQDSSLPPELREDLLSHFQ